eukprot:scaffold20279_cov52-Phaeocystis_antarctica.AAC.2
MGGARHARAARGGARRRADGAARAFTSGAAASVNLLRRAAESISGNLTEEKSISGISGIFTAERSGAERLLGSYSRAEAGCNASGLGGSEEVRLERSGASGSLRLDRSGASGSLKLERSGASGNWRLDRSGASGSLRLERSGIFSPEKAEEKSGA